MTNAHALARYAALCQEEEIVPIVEPEVPDGRRSRRRPLLLITEWLLKTVFEELYYQKVALEGMVLKPNMVIAGKKSKKRAWVEEVAREDRASCSRPACRPRCPASLSSPAASRTRKQPRTSTR